MSDWKSNRGHQSLISSLILGHAPICSSTRIPSTCPCNFGGHVFDPRHSLHMLLQDDAVVLVICVPTHCLHSGLTSRRTHLDAPLINRVEVSFGQFTHEGGH